MILMSGPSNSKANDLDLILRPPPFNPRELTMSLFTLASSLLRPTSTASRVQRQRPRTRLNLEALEDRRLLSHGFGLDDLQRVEVERPEPAGDTPSVSREVLDRGGRSNEAEPGDRGRHGSGHGKPANTPKNHHPKRHGAGEHVIRVIHA
jgi:hypothetical protein